MNKIVYISSFLIGGILTGGLIGYFAKRHYEKLAMEETKELEQYWRDKTKSIETDFDIAVCEIYELRQACKVMLDAAQYETILEQVSYNMKNFYKEHPNTRSKIEKSIAMYDKDDPFTVNRSMESKFVTYILAKELGYVDSDKDSKAEAKRAILRQIAESHMDDGSEEFDDMPPIGPDGDIIDEIDEEDPYSDAEPWTDDSKIFVSGEDVIRNEPYIISEWQFTYGKQHYTKVSLEYLCLDDTVLDEDESELDQEYIGAENLRAFETDDCDSIFIRNDQLEIDYEIMWTEGSYIHDVLGMPEAEVSGRRIWRSWEKE